MKKTIGKAQMPHPQPGKLRKYYDTPVHLRQVFLIYGNVRHKMSTEMQATKK
jgi:hypothetical protein